MTDPQSRQEARRLMRLGLSDEAIEAETGLRPLDILSLRAGASVEDAEEPPSRPSRGRRQGVTLRPAS